MKKSIQIIATALVMLFGNSAFSQNDTMYVVQNGEVISKTAISDIDSVIFYNPISIDTTNNSTITDADGNVYTSVTIGTQEWMAENLRTTKYSDGTAIPNVTGDTEWGNLNTGAWSHYDNDSSQYEATYGKLYNWYAVETGKLCPTGWHVPTDAEWTVLTDYLVANGHSGAEGKALKSTSGWNDGGNGTDDYGWNALPSGSWTEDGFSSIGYYDNWWSSSQHDSVDAWISYISAYSDRAGRIAYNKKYGFSVRCLRD